MESQVPTRMNGLALAGAIVGFIGLFGTILCCCNSMIGSGWSGFFGIPALILGILGKQQITQSNGMQSGNDIAIAAIVLGGTNLIIAALGIILLAFSMLGMFAMPAIGEIIELYY
jgi:hypothetical protein